MQIHQWSLQDAKNKFSALVDAAKQGEAQIVTRRGIPSAVVVSVEAFEKLQQQERLTAPHFIEHLLSGPRTDQVDALFERTSVVPRDIDLSD